MVRDLWAHVNAHPQSIRDIQAFQRIGHETGRTKLKASRFE
jgi:hypothetical protein